MAEELAASPIDKKKATYGEDNQADYLVLAKQQNSSPHQRQLFSNEDREIKEEGNDKLRSPMKAK